MDNSTITPQILPQLFSVVELMQGLSLQTSWKLWLPCALILFPVVQQYFRFTRLRRLQTRYGRDDADPRLARMTVDEAWTILMAIAQLEFPFFFRKALQFALFRVCSFVVSDTR